MIHLNIVVNYPNQFLNIVNKQFKFAGFENVNMQEIEPGVKVMEGKKEKVIPWYEYYYFNNEEEYTKWKEWARKKLEEDKTYDKKFLESDLLFIDLVYGMNIKLKKKEELL